MLNSLEFIQFHELVPYAAFGFTAAIFFFVVFRAVKMKPGRAEQLASLPLEDDQPANPTKP